MEAVEVYGVHLPSILAASRPPSMRGSGALSSVSVSSALTGVPIVITLHGGQWCGGGVFWEKVNFGINKGVFRP